ncbi:hypothetical protein [Lysinibacillus piscis]|uniref:Uncharacterized protein n=1 Tax=Lysinibacillus piscis TaxID=2518931 RepID=A0ABQ5NJP2_9BACI|nr:hypothetical protein [Lysinibacillus sp. KH24]GLC88590.1 hypothetical protein LYSBPC_17170 [Lysinibacillus sp. KH24]
MTNNRSAGGKLWLLIGLFIAIFGIGMTITTNIVNDRKIDAMTAQCEEEGGIAQVSKEKSLLSTKYAFECKK